MGGLFMLIVVVILAFILNLFMDTYLAIIIACVAFYAWYKLNQKASTEGLFHANLVAYKMAIMSGMEEEQARVHVVATRFPERSNERVLADIKHHYVRILTSVDSDAFNPPNEDLKIYICALFCYEHNIYFDTITKELQDRYIGQIEQEYNKLFRGMENYSGGETGEGTTTLAINGGTYTGPLVYGMAEGFGTWENPNGLRYEGEFKGNKFNGQGTFTYTNGAIYVGEFRINQRHGQGKMASANGTRYEGAWINDQRHGQGTFTYANGAIYVGEFKDDQMDGYGKITYENGPRYEGEFKNNKFNGQGTLTSPDDGRYEGTWKDDQMDGYGKITHANGDRYEGEWKDNKYNGQGTYIYGPDSQCPGDRDEGAWKDDLKHGQGKYTWADGAMIEGVWKDGELL